MDLDPQHSRHRHYNGDMEHGAVGHGPMWQAQEQRSSGAWNKASSTGTAQWSNHTWSRVAGTSMSGMDTTF